MAEDKSKIETADPSPGPSVSLDLWAVLAALLLALAVRIGVLKNVPW